MNNEGIENRTIITNFTIIAQAIMNMHPKMIKLDNLYLVFLFILYSIDKYFLYYVDSYCCAAMLMHVIQVER